MSVGCPFDLFWALWGAIGEHFRLVQRQKRFREPPHRSDRFEGGRLDVVLPRHTIIRVTEHHRRDAFPHADPLKVCCEAAPEAVPAFPLDPRRFERLFHLAMAKAVDVEGLALAVSDDRTG